MAQPTADTWKREQQTQGAFARKPVTFREFISTEPGARFAPASGRYHLYVSYACPWAHRTLITRALKGLQDAVSVDVVDWYMPRTGWTMKGEDPDATVDSIHGFQNLSELYFHVNPQFKGRFTVPILWDRENETIANNESSEIIRMFNGPMSAVATHPELDLCPDELLPAIDAVNAWVYPMLNNGVYRSGFATSQAAYEAAVHDVFAALDRLEGILSQQRWLAGDRFTEADVRVFPTLLRFDPVYYAHFKCSLRKLVDYPNLWAYTREIFQHPTIRQTVNMRHIRSHYFGSHASINPRLIVPLEPDLPWDEPHNRGARGGQSLVEFAPVS